jgi:DNA-binding transcriptional MerR regulator
MKPVEKTSRSELEARILQNLGTKVYYSIREAAEILDLKPYILRFWESQFPQLRPRTSKGGRRQYQIDDIKLLLLIKRLLYQQGYTIAGAKARLKEIKLSEPNQMDLPFEEWRKKVSLQGIAQELREIIQMLDRAK